MAQTRLPSTVGSQPHASVTASTTRRPRPQRRRGRPGTDHRCFRLRSCTSSRSRSSRCCISIVQPAPTWTIAFVTSSERTSMALSAVRQPRCIKPALYGTPRHPHLREVVIEAQPHQTANRPIRDLTLKRRSARTMLTKRPRLSPINVSRWARRGLERRARSRPYPTCRFRNHRRARRLVALRCRGRAPVGALTPRRCRASSQRSSARQVASRTFTGGAEGNRTPGLNSAIVALYQLSYSPAASRV